VKKMFFWVGLISVGWAAALAPASKGEEEPRLRAEPQVVRQGDCFFLRLSFGFTPSATLGTGQDKEGLDEAPPQARWMGRDFPLFREKRGWRAILPVAAETAPGPRQVAAIWETPAGEKKRLSATVIVEKRGFGKQHLRLPARQEALYTYPGVRREYRLIGAALRRFSPRARWEKRFAVPVDGKEKTAFGTQRYRNGKKQGIHKGIDYGAPEGTAVYAANSGVVALTAQDFRLHGKTVVIDHGQGVCTLYLHLSEILVNLGEQVERGAIIGRVGSTGVATGPHLHYALYVGGVAVDPAWWEEKAR